SHFDYLILSYIFHLNYLSPPHIAAGDNLSFWPMGPLFRGAGAFFIRRTFEDNELYKMVFRKYLTFLMREGYTQEFFIEGGRTRTGKILTPRLGMLSAFVNAFVQGVRRDLYFVPISIHYGRIPEEEKHRFIQRLGFRLLRAVNEAAVAGATAVSATALLGAPRAACRMSDFLAAAHALTGLLRTKGVRITESLDRNERSDFRESVN